MFVNLRNLSMATNIVAIVPILAFMFVMVRTLLITVMRRPKSAGFD